MALKTIVKVGKISNLSDARYCAGMNAAMLGFNVIEGQEHYVSPTLFKEIRGWFTGPSVVAEVYGINQYEDLAGIIGNYLPDFIEGSLRDIRKLHTAFAACILSSNYAELKAHEHELGLYRNQIAYILLPESTPEHEIEELAKEYKILLAIETENPSDRVLNNPHINGIALTGSVEDKPGLKNYDTLASVFERLEDDD